ncbi:hypothetical protein JHK85_032719 [Glycine max]|nr:hypothetical protein JHK85_032719 [Glycine max]
MAVVNQKKPTKTMWKESSICTKTWNNLVLQFMKVSDMLEADAGFLDALTTNPDELIDSEDSEGIQQQQQGGSSRQEVANTTHPMISNPTNVSPVALIHICPLRTTPAKHLVSDERLENVV